jgi:phytoene desaturase
MLSCKKGIFRNNSGKEQSSRRTSTNFTEQGFKFDMGPSWYWMPDVFDSFFEDFGKNTSDFYRLKRLSPSYQIVFGKNESIFVPSNLDEFYNLFENLEKGSSSKLKIFLKEAQYKYEVGMQDLVHKPGLSILEFADKRVIKGIFKMHLLQSFSTYIRKHFSNPKIIQLLEFPILFLGAQPKDIPALYSLMNYADIVLGTWYPMGGMHKIVEAMVSIATELGVKIKLNEEVKKINTLNKRATSVLTSQNEYKCDTLIGAGDYHHIEQKILEKEDRQYSEEYWNNRILAPSSLLFYLGLDIKVENLIHHNLFFDADFDQHATEIYQNPGWPSNPLFYVSVTSKTDESAAPKGHENLFILIPVAPDLQENSQIIEHYYNMVMERIASHVGHSIKEHVIFRRDYSGKNFITDYNSYKGNAYGLANTLRQTAILKPKIKSSKIKNLYYTGQLTVPGPGVPPSLISGKVVANLISKTLKVSYGFKKSF